MPKVQQFATFWTCSDSSWETLLHDISFPEPVVAMVSAYLYACGLKKEECMNVQEKHILCLDCSEAGCPDSEDDWATCASGNEDEYICNRIIHRLCTNPLRECPSCKEALDYCSLHARIEMCHFGHLICSECRETCTKCKLFMCDQCIGDCWLCTKNLRKKNCKTCVFLCEKCELHFCTRHGDESASICKGCAVVDQSEEEDDVW